MCYCNYFSVSPLNKRKQRHAGSRKLKFINDIPLQELLNTFDCFNFHISSKK